ncbi:hypothetical protein BGW38_008810 [Lunasporangiospora selenospora]|uniref:RCC1-like domain-containing protein n=1 Tax=Lunasporangiospora selenospora TaxID=979761 RepID=A0A9P6G2H6_9FUNG|nr:hypothetical protein BGW38_008810 [Lunasporangiospora selenospora]
MAATGLTPSTESPAATKSATGAVQSKKRTRNSSGFVAPNLKKTKSAGGSSLELPVAERATEVGKVYVFGTGDCAQLGLGEDITLRKKPANVAVLNDQNIVDISAGGLHNMALTSEGKLWSWGVNDQKTLARSGDEYVPLPVEGLEDVKVVKVACSDSMTVALTEEGQVYTWGTFRSAEGILGHSKSAEVQEAPSIVSGLEKVVDIATGTDHVLALTSSGRVYSWGNGQQMQLGRRIVSRRMLNGVTPESVGIKGIAKVGAGSYHSFAIDKDGKTLAWGLNTYGQSGDDSAKVELIPTASPIKSLADETIVDIQGGEHHSIALTKDGRIFGFGRSDSHQLGLGYTVEPGVEDDKTSHKKAIRHPTEIKGLPKIKSISIGGNHTLALSEDGDVYAWGFGEMYACGNGEEEDVETPQKVSGQQIQDSRVIKVAGGGQHSVILAVSKKQE